MKKSKEELKETTIVRQNMMDNPNYQGYCGNAWNSGCSMPRTIRMINLQSKCPECGWVSQYPEDFIKRYKEKHGL